MPASPEPPSGRVVVAGGLGVLVVIAFVSLVGAGARVRELPGDKVGLFRGDGPAGVVVLTGRCTDQRVRSVELLDGDASRWRVSSRKGTITRRWVVGGELPTGAVEEVAFVGPAPARMVARVGFVEEDGRVTVDEQQASLAGLEEEPPLRGAAPACASDVGGGPVSWFFVVSGASVVAGYAVMLSRWWKGRRS